MKIGIEATFISPTHILGENRTKQRKPPKKKQHLREMKTSRQKTIEGISAGLTVRMRVIQLYCFRHIAIAITIAIAIAKLNSARGANFEVAIVNRRQRQKFI